MSFLNLHLFRRSHLSTNRHTKCSKLRMTIASINVMCFLLSWVCPFTVAYIFLICGWWNPPSWCWHTLFFYMCLIIVFTFFFMVCYNCWMNFYDWWFSVLCNGFLRFLDVSFSMFFSMVFDGCVLCFWIAFLYVFWWFAMVFKWVLKCFYILWWCCIVCNGFLWFSMLDGFWWFAIVWCVL